MLNADLLEQVIFPLPWIQRSETSTEFDLFHLLQTSILHYTLCGTPPHCWHHRGKSCTIIQSNYHIEHLSAGKAGPAISQRKNNWSAGLGININAYRKLNILEPNLCSSISLKQENPPIRSMPAQKPKNKDWVHSTNAVQMEQVFSP